MSVKFILFDAYGTLLRIPRGRHPYRQILKEGIKQGRRPQPDDLRKILTCNLSLGDAAEAFGIKIEPQQMADIEGDLAADLISITPYEDGLQAVEKLQAEGMRVAVASNLAAPYSQPIQSLYPSVDAFGFSFSIGSMKPEPFFYRATCELVGASSWDIDSGKVLMIGDSEKCDCDGPQAIGIRGFLLSRESGKGFSTLDEFSDMVLKGLE